MSYTAPIIVYVLQKRNLARRFITLLDELYNKRTRFVCTAAAPPEHLFAGTLDDQPIIDLEQLQFESAVEGQLHSAALLHLPACKA